ncbi:kinesin family member 10, partial [Reticulomyxa filosa]
NNNNNNNNNKNQEENRTTSSNDKTNNNSSEDKKKTPVSTKNNENSADESVKLTVNVGKVQPAKEEAKEKEKGKNVPQRAEATAKDAQQQGASAATANTATVPFDRLIQDIEDFTSQIHESLSKFDAYGNGTLDPMDFAESLRGYLPNIDPSKCQILHEFFCDLSDDKISNAENKSGDMIASLSIFNDPTIINSTTQSQSQTQAHASSNSMKKRPPLGLRNDPSAKVRPSANGNGNGNSHDPKTSSLGNMNGNGKKNSPKLLSGNSGYSMSKSQTKSMDDQSQSSSGIQAKATTTTTTTTTTVSPLVSPRQPPFALPPPLPPSSRSQRKREEDSDHTYGTTLEELVISDGSTLYVSSLNLKFMEMSIDKFIRVLRIFALSQIQIQQQQQHGWNGYTSPTQLLKHALEQLFPYAIRHFYPKLLHRIRHDLESANEKKTGFLSVEDLIHAFHKLNSSETNQFPSMDFSSNSSTKTGPARGSTGLRDKDKDKMSQHQLQMEQQVNHKSLENLARLVMQLNKHYAHKDDTDQVVPPPPPPSIDLKDIGSVSVVDIMKRLEYQASFIDTTVTQAAKRLFVPRHVQSQDTGKGREQEQEQEQDEKKENEKNRVHSDDDNENDEDDDKEEHPVDDSTQSRLLSNKIDTPADWFPFFQVVFDPQKYAQKKSHCAVSNQQSSLLCQK